jgi:hypothetical protein
MGTNAAVLVMIFNDSLGEFAPITLSKNQTFNQGSIPIGETLCSCIILDPCRKWRLEAHFQPADFREFRLADSVEGA